MYITNYLTNNEMALHSIQDALMISEILLNNNYVCMISKEENLFIVNYEWNELCDRNGVVFKDRWELEEEIEKLINSDEEEKND